MSRPSFRPVAPSADPFFEKPYESSERVEPAAWEKSKPAGPAPKGLSAYIKPKRQVAALFGGKPKAPAESA